MIANPLIMFKFLLNFESKCYTNGTDSNETLTTPTVDTHEKSDSSHMGNTLRTNPEYPTGNEVHQSGYRTSNGNLRGY